jgi:galactokinase
VAPDQPAPRHLADRVRRALSRIEAQGAPEEVGRLATALFEEVYERHPSASDTRNAFVPLIAEHTRYFGGFGLLMRTPASVGVAASPSEDQPQTVVSGEGKGAIRRFIERLRASVGREHDSGFDVAVVSAAPVGGEEALLAAAGVSFLHAIGFPQDPARIGPLVADAMEAALRRPCGAAQVLAAIDGAPLVLVDAGTYEHVDLVRPDTLGAAVVEVGPERFPDPSIFRDRQALLEASMALLRERGYPDLTTLRRLEHQDLPRALEMVDAEARPFLYHVVTEDRRVPRLVASIRRDDLQVAGALLLMSHASRREDARASTEEVEYVIGMAETTEGVYGARMSGPGFGGRVVLVGRSFLLPDIVDDLGAQFARRFGVSPRIALL